MPSYWEVILSMDQKSNPYIEYSVDYDEKNKHLTVDTPNTKYGLLETNSVVHENILNREIVSPWSPIHPNINKVTISTPGHITYFERKIFPFNAKKKRAVKSKSKSRRKSRSPRRV